MAEHREPAIIANDCGIPGLGLIPDFVSEEEEILILQAVQAAPWEHLARRRVQHYGFPFDYIARNVDHTKPVKAFPPWLEDIVKRVQGVEGVPAIDQLTINEYAPGVGLSAHVDTHSGFTGAVVSLSLGSQTVMELRRGGDHRPLLLPRRSLLILGGEARYAWHHYIPHRKSDWLQGRQVPRTTRTSLTFRQVRGYPCDCAYAEECDSQGGGMPITRMAQRLQTAGTPHPRCGTRHTCTLCRISRR
eukprot:jgi/Botrbrau1/13004/Bobra.0389s0003.1